MCTVVTLSEWSNQGCFHYFIGKSILESVRLTGDCDEISHAHSTAMIGHSAVPPKLILTIAILELWREHQLEICVSTIWNAYAQKQNNCFDAVWFFSNNHLTTVWHIFDPRQLTFELTRFRRVAGASRLACTQQTHCGMHASIFSHTRMTTRANNSGLCPSGERSRSSTRGKNADLPIISRAVLKWPRSSKG